MTSLIVRFPRYVSIKSCDPRTTVLERSGNTSFCAFVTQCISSPVMAPEFGNIGTNRIPVPVTEGQTALIGALENSSPGAPPPNTLRLTQIIRQARNGTCAVNNPRGRRIAYTPQNGYLGRDRCTYELCDSRAMCGNAELFVLVEPGE